MSGFDYIYDGIVVDNQDPEGLARVRVLIPGLIEPMSGWAEPVGAGGSAQRGMFDVPEKGATVSVQFLMGDPDRPKYAHGYWGKPGGQSEVPTYAQGLAKGDVAKVKVYETAGYSVIIDDRAATKKLSLRDKTNAVQLDIYDDRAEVKWGGDTGTLIRVKDARIQLGKDAVQSIVKGDLWWEAEDAALTGVIMALRAVSAGCAGPLAALKPGVEAEIAFWQQYKDSGANKAFLSKLSKTE